MIGYVDKAAKNPVGATSSGIGRDWECLGAWRTWPCRRLFWSGLEPVVLSTSVLLPAASDCRPAVATNRVCRAKPGRPRASDGAAILVLLQQCQGLLPLRQGMSRWLAEGFAGTGEVIAMNDKVTYWLRAVSATGVLLLGACTVMPTGPSVMVLPGTGQTIERFRDDENLCRQYAYYQIGGKSADQAARDSAVTSAVVGTAIGAVAGAAIGGRDGAAVGAGAGLLVGSAAGSDAARSSGMGTQHQYDNAYIQCMYTKGHRVPVPANMAYSKPVRAANFGIPPPPPGAPPPPPPGVSSSPSSGMPPPPPPAR